MILEFHYFPIGSASSPNDCHRSSHRAHMVVESVRDGDGAACRRDDEQMGQEFQEISGGTLNVRHDDVVAVEGFDCLQLFSMYCTQIHSFGFTVQPS